MVFRTQITHDDGTIETLQVCSQQIICSKCELQLLFENAVKEHLTYVRIRIATQKNSVAGRH